MRQKMEESQRLLLQRYEHFLSQYELLLSQNNLKAIKIIEKQIAWLVQTTVSFFSYGLPSSTNKSSFYPIRKSASDDESSMQATMEKKAKPEFLDFQIVQRILLLCKITNQLRANDPNRPIYSELEVALLHFCVTYKNHVMTDSRLIMLGAHLSSEPDDEAFPVDTLEGAYNESKSAYTMLAKLSGYQTMQEVVEIFTQKLV